MKSVEHKLDTYRGNVTEIAKAVRSIASEGEKLRAEYDREIRDNEGWRVEPLELAFHLLGKEVAMSAKAKSNSEEKDETSTSVSLEMSLYARQRSSSASPDAQQDPQGESNSPIAEEALEDNRGLSASVLPDTALNGDGESNSPIAKEAPEDNRGLSASVLPDTALNGEGESNSPIAKEAPEDTRGLSAPVLPDTALDGGGETNSPIAQDAPDDTRGLSASVLPDTALDGGGESSSPKLNGTRPGNEELSTTDFPEMSLDPEGPLTVRGPSGPVSPHLSEASPAEDWLAVGGEENETYAIDEGSSGVRDDFDEHMPQEQTVAQNSSSPSDRSGWTAGRDKNFYHQFKPSTDSTISQELGDLVGLPNEETVGGDSLDGPRGGPPRSPRSSSRKLRALNYIRRTRASYEQRASMAEKTDATKAHLARLQEVLATLDLLERFIGERAADNEADPNDDRPVTATDLRRYVEALENRTPQASDMPLGNVSYTGGAPFLRIDFYNNASEADYNQTVDRAN